jgi:hypothetical protein
VDTLVMAHAKRENPDKPDTRVREEDSIPPFYIFVRFSSLTRAYQDSQDFARNQLSGTRR